MALLLSFTLTPLNRFIDQTGMYRMVTLALSALAGGSISFGLFGLIPFTALELGVSLFVTLATALFANVIFSKVWRVAANHESAVITALIIFFLVIPARVETWTDQWVIVVVTVLAIASKYILAWRGQHLLNPAAAGAVVLSLVYAIAPIEGFFETVWWIGTPVLFVPLLLAGSLVVTKIRRWPLVLAFLVSGFLVYTIEDWRFGLDPLTTYERFVIAGPSFFLAFFMLTEPFTTPPTKQLQIFYGVFIGVLANVAFLAPIIKMTPELALIIGNLAFWPTTLQRKLILSLKETKLLARDTVEFIFEKPAGLRFKAGQYLEWMLPHSAPDTRGVRRYFTIASSPTESDIRLALKIMPEQGSTYKSYLKNLTPGGTIIASQLAGDFLLPMDPTLNLGFIAGGIGVTPFRSQIKYMVDATLKHDTVLFYCNNTREDIAYEDEFTEASTSIPLTVIHVLAKETLEPPFESGFVTVEMLERRVPDFRERTWYLSGPPGMVNAYDTMLKTAGVPTSQIIKDFFPGLA